MFGDLEKSCSAIFGVNVFGDLEKLCSTIFGVNVFGDCGVLGERIGDRHGVAYSLITVSETYNGGKNGGKLWRLELY